MYSVLQESKIQNRKVIKRYTYVHIHMGGRGREGWRKTGRDTEKGDKEDLATHNLTVT